MSVVRQEPSKLQLEEILGDILEEVNDPRECGLLDCLTCRRRTELWNRARKLLGLEPIGPKEWMKNTEKLARPGSRRKR